MIVRAGRRRLLATLACVLLVVVLTGQPAWGDASATRDRGRAAGPATTTVDHAGETNPPQDAPSPSRTSDPVAAAGVPSNESRQQPIAPPAGTPTPPVGDTPAPPAPERPPVGDDPTPARTVDPSPVEVPGGTAPPEQGAESPATPTVPSPAPEPAIAAPEQAQAEAEAPAVGVPSLSQPSFHAAVRAPMLVPNEIPDTTAPVPAPTIVTPDPSAAGSLAQPLPGVGQSPGAPSRPPAGTDAAPLAPGEPPRPRDPQAGPSLALPTNPTPGPVPTGRPIQDGPVLQLPARQITQTARRTPAPRPRRGASSGLPALAEQSSAGLNQVANLVKDIPAWVELALAGLAALVLLLGAYSVAAAARARRLRRQRARLMEDIGLLQEALLPAVPGRLGALLTTVAYRPADGPAAGGDFYDAFALSDGRVGLLLGDISGHGRQALAKTTLVRFTVRAHLEAGLSPREALAISGRSLDGRLADDFATVIAAIHDPVKGTLTYASSGHPAPLVIGPAAHEPVTASSAPPIGAGFPTGQRQTVLPMPESSTLAMYSDGLIEARVQGQELGRERLTRWLAQLGPGATAAALLNVVVERADRVTDDLAAVVLHAAPGASAPAARIEQLKIDVLDVEGPELDGFLRASGVSRADRALASRRVAEQLAVNSGVVVEVRMGDHPVVSVAPIGDLAPGARPSSRAR